jgi:hypothetical protein
MSWRFRKTFKVLPGVKLNLTAHGLSATFGVAPFSINVGPRGMYRNVSIPGTGIWDRQRIGGPSLQPSGIQPPTTDHAGSPTIPFVPPSIPVPPPDATEIQSASTELLTSGSLEDLRRLLTDAYNERDELTKDISSATFESNTATRRYHKWEHGFLLKRLFKHSFTIRKEAADTAAAKLEELQEQLRLTTIATEITIDREQAEPYYRMRDAFSGLSECRTIWNVLTEKAIDRVVERSTANTAVTRNPVSFSLGSCDLIQWEQRVPHFQNQTGGDMYIYPGFILYRASKQAFALIAFHDVSLNFVSTQFTEADTVPSDTQVIGHTWAKANKDGTPDRRFANNYQIPVVHYASLLFSSVDGLDIRYLCSNAALAERFVKAWAAFHISFSARGPDGAQSPEQPKATNGPVDNFKIVSERFKIASEQFNTADDSFMKSLITPTGKGKLAQQNFLTYMAAVVEYIGAARGYMESADPLQHHTAKATFQRAIETFEAARARFEKAVCEEHRMDTELFTTYADALAAFLKAIAQYSGRLWRVGGARNQKRGAAAN